MKLFSHHLTLMCFIVFSFHHVSFGQSCSDGSYSFADDIAPILNLRCSGCHGGLGGFNVSTYANVLAGGNNCGPGVTPGDATAAASSLINKLQWAVGGPNATCGSNMPQIGGPLTQDQFLAIESWISAGAPEFCPEPCPPDLTFSGGGGLSGSESSVVIFQTDGAIESTQQILVGGVVDYNAGTMITLLEGFEVVQTAEFHAYIDGCN